MPNATVWASGHGCTRRSPASKARTTGAQPAGLHRDQPRAGPVRQPAELAQLLDGLVDADEARPRRRWGRR